MTIKSAIITFIVITAIIVEIVIAVSFIFKKVLPYYKRYSANLSMTELLVSLNAIIENEINVYERSIFDGGRKIVNNSQYNNYYKDLAERIIDDLSPEFFERVSFFMKKEAIVSLICRTVKDYLSEKIL